MDYQPLGLRDALYAAVILAIAVALRVGYLLSCVPDLSQPPPFQVQDAQTAITWLPREVAPSRSLTASNQLVHNIAESNWFGGPAWLQDSDEVTAHLSPGYPFLVGYVARWIG